MSEIKIAVIGLGLIGGSILKALKEKDYYLIGVSRSQDTIDKVKNENLANEASTNLEIVANADIVFVCTPINKTIDIVEKVSQIVSKQCIITDVASLKGFIMDHFRANEEKINFIGGHPMAGTENKGIDAAQNGLFEDAKWVLTPAEWSWNKDIQKLKKVIEDMGAKVIIADPYEHDKATALISHMPMLISQALFGMVNSYPEKNIRDLALKLASSGFRDMTRLACSNPEMANDMLSLNSKNIDTALNKVFEYAQKLKADFNINDEKFLKDFEQTINARKAMYNSNGKNSLG